MYLVCAVCVLALPSAASAKPGYYVGKPERFVVMNLRGSNGYRINVIGLDSKHVILLANKDGMSVGYRTRGQITDDRVEASFGNRGRVSVRLPQGKATKSAEVPPHCKGRQATIQEGRFVGSIRFRGEQGFTRVSTGGAHGIVLHSYHEVCKRGKQPHYKSPPASSLDAASSNPQLPWFSVFKEEPHANQGLFFSEEAHYTARQSERREGMWINRSASASAPPETFTLSAPRTSPVIGTVAPPAPFSGTATYERNPNGAGTWTGSLAVELPGLGQMPLTGLTYSAQLCHSFGCACPPHQDCFFLVGVSVRPLAAAYRLREAAPTPNPWRWPGSPR